MAATYVLAAERLFCLPIAKLTFFCGVLFSVYQPSLADNPLRGWAGGEVSKVEAINGGWFYHWGLSKPAGNYDASFLPMFWGGGSVTTANINQVLSYGDTTHVLGFNEPERSDQANMSVATAISKWQMLDAGFAGSGIQLV